MERNINGPECLLSIGNREVAASINVTNISDGNIQISLGDTTKNFPLTIDIIINYTDLVALLNQMPFIVAEEFDAAMVKVQ